MNNREIEYSSRGALVSKRGNKFFVTSAYLGLAIAMSVLAKPSLAAPEGKAEQVSKANSALSKRDAELLAKFRANNWSNYVPEHLSQIKEAMTRSAALREEVVQRFQGATDNVQRHHFTQLLRVASIPGFTAKALEWARDSENTKTRMSAFTYLSTQEQTPEIQALFLNALMKEQNIEVLGKVVLFLKPVDVPDSGTAPQVVSRLHDLTQHESTEVRFGSLQRLAEWDKAFRFFPDDVMRLLNDPESIVRVAALGATSISEYSSEPLKLRMLEILADPKETLEVRSVAAMNIDRFDFKGAEYVKYKEALAAFKKAAATPVASLKH